MISQIRTYEDAHGETQISLLDSYLWARQDGLYYKVKKEGWSDEFGFCNYHDPEKAPGLMKTKAGWARCICDLMAEETWLREAQVFSSSSAPRTWENFDVWGDKDSQDALIIARDTVMNWMSYPDKWLVLGGGFGTGKTLLLHIINSYFHPWSMYVAVPDFEQLVFQYTAEKELDSVISIIASQPILLLDDVGADYGSNYPKTMLRRVIDYRYRRWKEYPTVLTTNMSPQQLEVYDGRVADRILDKSISQVISMNKVKSWRRNGSEK